MEWWPLKLQATKAWSVATFAPILWGILLCSSPFQHTHTLYSRVPSFWCWGDTVLWKIPRVLHIWASDNKALLLQISGLGVSFSKPSFWVTYSLLHSWPASQKHAEGHGFRPSLHPYSRGTDSLPKRSQETTPWEETAVFLEHHCEQEAEYWRCVPLAWCRAGKRKAFPRRRGDWAQGEKVHINGLFCGNSLSDFQTFTFTTEEPHISIDLRIKRMFPLVETCLKAGIS